MAGAQLLRDDIMGFLEHCKNKFGWSDLKEESIMDVGCGFPIKAGKVLLDQYPGIRLIIVIDKDPDVVWHFRESPIKGIECTVADIEKRDTILPYIGKMNKVLSTSVFQELKDIQTAFQNVYDLLLPGGEAALLFFTRSSTHEWFMEMVKITKWKDIYQGFFKTDSFLHGLSKKQYLEMVRKIGFEVVEYFPQEIITPYETDQIFLDIHCSSFRIAFKVPPELLEEFKKDTLEVLEKVSGRNAQGRLIYRAYELVLLLRKPKEGSRLLSKESHVPELVSDTKSKVTQLSS